MIFKFYKMISVTQIISAGKTSSVFMLFMKNLHNLLFGNTLLPFLPFFTS